LANLDENGAGFSSKDLFEGQKADIEFVQVRYRYQILFRLTRVIPVLRKVSIQ
jgi:hypothetical protein